MATHKNLIVIELTVTYNNLIYRAEQSAVDKEDALDASIDKIIRQIRKNKTRVEKKLKEAAFTGMLEEPVVEADHEAVSYTHLTRISSSFLQNPLRTAATTVAQVPVPQAKVSPLPRSHTRIRCV